MNAAIYSPAHPADQLAEFTDADAALTRITEIYRHSVSSIKARFDAFAQGRPLPSAAHACYPYLGISVNLETMVTDSRPSWGTVAYPGVYGTTLTRPDLFADYFRDQIERLMRYHRVPVVVGTSRRPIPLPFVIEASTTDINHTQARELAASFVLPELSRIDDAIANGTYESVPGEADPLSMFPAERVDLALQRLYHYTGTAPEHFQRFVLFTNYQRYVDEFIELGRSHMAAEHDDGNGYVRFVEPGDVVQERGGAVPDDAARPRALPQMPAYHLVRGDKLGVTLVNIGVGPSNAKTMTDHLAVLRPHCWLMVGHCGGLRRSQQLGDYVLAHAYVRDDHVLDQDLPPWVPVPPIAEIQVALQEAVARVTGLSGTEMKTRMRTGTVVSTDDRNWELKSKALYARFNQSRAIAIDMESATVAANGFRLRVPYGTLLCVSDKPLHGELKLRGMANAFYRQRVSQHMTIGLEAIRILRENGVEQLHSRKLRSFDEPAFR
ncbi:AMP nucleosidase [Cupriavidus malaysiensis]|uniref:AMP nucleosidase n=1 Tax=Cupriavidus malaysiensis TaxID=367825 RepID=A0ABN4TLU4_9BURK|nr:AMP nucleosidase [Cupriavidus malaysiensis]AOZ08337.1 AMP nucleosidase [Cupriavidus malaysiensis]